MCTPGCVPKLSWEKTCNGVVLQKHIFLVHLNISLIKATAVALYIPTETLEHMF